MRPEIWYGRRDLQALKVGRPVRLLSKTSVYRRRGVVEVVGERKVGWLAGLESLELCI